MEFSQSLSSTEYILISIFIILYALFATRAFYAAKQLKTSFHKIIFKLVLRLFYFGLLLIVLLEPYIPNQQGKKEVKAVSKDIFIALDLSLSMNAEDIAPNRLKRVQFELKKITEKLKGNRIGLIVFSSNAYLQCPLTYDLNAYRLFLDACSTDLLSQSGTDISSPLEMALDKLSTEKNTDNHAKAIVLISDGEDFGDEMFDIASRIKKENINFFALGVGTESGAKIPIKGGFKQDHSGETVITTLNKKALQELTSITNGRYFEISSIQNDAQRLTNAIDQLKGTSRENIKISTPKNLIYHYFIYVALFLILIDLFVSFKILKI